MIKQPRLWTSLFVLLISASLLLGACGPRTTPTAAPTQAAAQPTQAPTPEPVARGPQEGGKLVIGISEEPPTLDAHRATGDLGLAFLGAGLIAKDKDNNYVSWVAKDWELSPDGMMWTFTLREDVKFQDGTPLTAHDYVYSYNRAVDPAIASPIAGQMLASVESFEAPDDYTLVLKMKEPMAPFMDNLVAAGFLTPLSQAWVEQYGEDYARNPMSIGPYKLKEWVTGDHITLERNPDYTWQPAYVQHEGPHYIQEIELRIIPEIATMVAGLEAGELDYVYGLEPQYVSRIEGTGNFEILTTYIAGGSPIVTINVSKWPFDDLRVRQAVNYAIDRQAMIDVIQKGNARIQYGPISPPTTGYWEGVEEIGYDYDPEKAKSLLAEAGWSDSNSDGIVEKDGQPLTMAIPVISDYVKEAEMLTEQLRAVGIGLTIEQGDLGTVVGKIVTGDYEISILGFQWPNYDILWLLFHSKQIGVLNLDHVNDPDLDALLDKMRTETDMSVHQSWVDQAQKLIVEQAYIVPLYNSQTFYPLSKRVQGAYLSQNNNNLYLEDAWIAD